MSSLVKMNYEVHGRGNPLLCIHGFGASLYSWREFVKDGSPLTANYQVITIDLKAQTGIALQKAVSRRQNLMIYRPPHSDWSSSSLCSS